MSDDEAHDEDRDQAHNGDPGEDRDGDRYEASSGGQGGVGPRQRREVYPELLRWAAGLAAFSVVGLGIGLAKLDRVDRGLVPPSVDQGGAIISPYAPVTAWLIGAGVAAVAAVVVLIAAFRPMR